MAVTVSELRALVGMDDADFQKGIEQIKSSLKETADEANKQGTKIAEALETASKKSVKSMDTISKKAVSTGKALSVAVTLPLALLGKQAVDIAATFEQSMDILQSTSGATADQMAQLGKLAKDLGGDFELPGTSASDAAAAMNELVRSNISLTDTMDAARPVLQLSAATMLGNAQAADVVASALNTFNLKGTDAKKVADLFAAASSRAQGGAQGLAQAMDAGGLAAASAGLHIDQFITILGLMAKNGVVGADAGTALRRTLDQLAKPTKEASEAMATMDKKFGTHISTSKNVRDAAEQLKIAFAGMTATQQKSFASTVAGEDGQRALIVLAREGAAGYDKMEKAVNRQGAAAALAAAKNKGLKGALDAMRSAFDTALQAGIEPFIKDLTSLGKSAGNLIAAFSNIPVAGQKTIVIFLAVAASLGPVILGIAKLIPAIKTIQTTLAGARLAGGIAGFFASGPVMMAITAIIIVIGALVLAWTTNFGHIQEVTYDAFNTIVQAFETFGSGVSDIWNGILNALSGEWDEGLAQIKRGSDNALNALAKGAEKAGAERARMDKEQAEAAVRTAAEANRQRVADHLATQQKLGGGLVGPGRGGELSERAKQEAELKKDLIQVMIKLGSARAGESKDIQNLRAQYPLLSAAMLQNLVAKEQELEKINEAAASHKKYVIQLADVNAHIKTLKAGGSTAIRDLAKEFPGLSRNLLAYLANQIQWEKHLEIVKQRASQVASTLRSTRADWIAAATGNEVAAAAVKLYGDKWLEILPHLNRAEQVLGLLTDAEKKSAEEFAELMRKAKVTEQLKALKEADTVLKSFGTKTDPSDKRFWVFKFSRNEQNAMALYKKELAAISKEEMEAADHSLELSDNIASAKLVWEHDEQAVQNANTARGKIQAGMEDVKQAAIAEAAGTEVARLAWEELGIQLESLPPLFQQMFINMIRVRKETESLKGLKESFASVFEGAFMETKNGFKAFASSIISGVEDLLRQIAAKFLAARLTEALFHLIPGGGKFLAGLQAASTIGAKASGGRFDAGESFVAGENGPELLRFDRGGHVSTAKETRAMSGGGGVTVVQHIHVADASSVHRSASSIRSDALRLAEAARRKDLK